MSRKTDKSSLSVSWRQFVRCTYPDILSRTYCVPPLHFNRVPYDRVHVPGIPTALPALVQQFPLGLPSGPGGPPSSSQHQSQIEGSISSHHQQTTAASAQSTSSASAQSTSSASAQSTSSASAQSTSSASAQSTTSRSAQSGSAQSGSAQSTPSRSAQSGSAQSGSAQSGSAQSRSAQSGSAQSGSAQPRSAQSRSAQSPPLRSAQSRSAQSTPSGSAQAGSSSQSPSAQSPSAQSRSAQSTPSGSAQAGSSSQSPSAQSPSAQSRNAQPTPSGSAQAGSSSQSPSAQSPSAQSRSAQSTPSGSAQAGSSSQSPSAQSPSAQSRSAQSTPSGSAQAGSSSQSTNAQSSHSIESSPKAEDPPLSDYSLWPPEQPPPHAHGAAAVTPSTVYRSDTTDDLCQQFLLHNLYTLAKHVGEVMFILSSVNFQNYLSSRTSGITACQQQFFPRPGDLQKNLRGDFDFLIIHRDGRLLVGEMKSVGRQRTELGLSQSEDDQTVVRRVYKAVKQLDKGREVVSHLVSDLDGGLPLPVYTCLFLPFVSQEQLRRVLTDNPDLAQKVCNSLRVSTAQEAVAMTLCSDDLSDPNDYWDVISHVLSRLTSWWQRRMTSCPGQPLSDDHYLDIVGRFVGPVTTVSVHCNARPRITVEVRTEGEALAELGMRLARLVLTPEQVDLLNRAPPRVFLTGPPGTGKSVMLILMSVVWLYRGWAVQVVSLTEASEAASRLVYHQIRKTLEHGSGAQAASTTGRVRFHSFPLHEDYIGVKVTMETVVKTLTEASRGQPLCVVMDEASCWPYLEELMGKLREVDPNLRLWAAHVEKRDMRAHLQTERMTRPLRSAPCVIRELQKAINGRNYEDKVEPYSTEGIPSPADGLGPRELHHHGPDHDTSLDPISCYLCGLQLADTLHSLAVGHTGRLVPNSPDSLQFRDVLILAVEGIDTIHDDLADPGGTTTVLQPASALVRGLRAQGIPVGVLENPDKTRDVWEKVRWEKHHLNGCRRNDEPDDDVGLGIKFLLGIEEEVTTWDMLNSEAKKEWSAHFEKCELESKEEKEKWKTYKEREWKAWKEQLEDVVTCRHDRVTVTSERFVQGLERKVVVALMRSMDYLNDIDTMGCVSRCTTHLILVHSGQKSTKDPHG